MLGLREAFREAYKNLCEIEGPKNQRAYRNIVQEVASQVKHECKQMVQDNLVDIVVDLPHEEILVSFLNVESESNHVVLSEEGRKFHKREVLVDIVQLACWFLVIFVIELKVVPGKKVAVLEDGQSKGADNHIVNTNLTVVCVFFGHPLLPI